MKSVLCIRQSDAGDAVDGSVTMLSMSQGDDDEIPELPGDALDKQRYLLQLSLDRLKSKRNSPDSAVSKVAEGARKILEGMENARVSLLPTVSLVTFKPNPFIEAVSRLNAELQPALERDAARKQKWREEWEAGQIAAPISAPADPAPLSAAARRKPVTSPDEIQRLRQYRRELLARYKAATGHSSRVVFEEGPARNLHTCHKQKFHLWQKGELSADSAPSTSLERILVLLVPIPGVKTKRKRIID